MKNITNVTKKLVSFKTVQGNFDEFKKCFNYIKTLLENEGLNVKIYKKNNNISLLSSTRIKTKYKTLLAGHIDVVSASPNKFKPLVKGNKLFARGAIDMKGPIACMIAALIDQFNKNKDIDLGILITSDEEVGGFNGTKFMLNEVGLTAKNVFLPDTRSGYKLLKEAKGALHLKFSAVGSSAHGSAPWKGSNAILNLMKVYQKIDESLNKATNKNGWKTSVNLGKFSGGDNVNSVADFAEMYLDIRYPSTRNSTSLMKTVNSIIKQHKNVSCEKIVVAKPMQNNLKNKYFQVIKKLIKKHKGFEPEIIREYGASDGRFFSEKNIPVVMINPKGSNAHVEEEWVDIKDMKIFKKILCDYISKVS